MLMLLLFSQCVCDVVLDILWLCGFGVSCMFIYVLFDYVYLCGIVLQEDVFNVCDFVVCMLIFGNSVWQICEEMVEILQVLVCV